MSVKVYNKCINLWRSYCVSKRRTRRKASHKDIKAMADEYNSKWDNRDGRLLYGIICKKL